MDDRGWRFGGIFLLVLLQNGVEFARGRPVLSHDSSPFVDTRSLSAEDLKFTHALPVGILVTVSTLVSLLMVLVLCACAERPERNEEPNVPAVENNGVTPVPSPEAAPVSAQDVTITVPLNDAPKQRTASVQSTSSNPGATDPDPLVRCPTIDRRLPELPPTPMPLVTPTQEEDEDDYNRTYDVIGETKTANPPTQNGGAADDKDDFEDDQYASVTDAPDKPRFPNADAGNEAECNGLVAAGPDMPEDGGDEPYASVNVNDEKEEENASYASVANKEEKDGYSRLRSIQKHRPKPDGPENGEQNGYARLRDVTIENAAVGGAVGGAAAAAPNDDDEVPPVPFKPPDLQNEDEDEQDASAAQRAGNAVSAMANDGGAPASSSKRREPPYTQVSARESLEVVRARQQAEQSARIAAHYQTIEEDQNLDADHDGIYEPVDDQQMDGQPVMAPPPLPSDRQTPSNEPSASNNWQILRAPRVYEEITEETRPKPPQSNPAAATNTQADDDDIQPYAVTEKRPVPTDKPKEQKTEANYAKVNKAAKGPDQINNNARTEVRVPDQAAGPVSENGLPLYAVVEKKSKGQGLKSAAAAEGGQSAAGATASPSTLTLEDNYQSVDDSYQAVEDDYQSVPETPGNGNITAAAIAGGMILTSNQPTREDLWTKKEHMYIDVETNQPSSPTETKGSSASSPRGHSYESVEVTQQAVSKKEKAKQAKKAKKEAKQEAKRERKLSKSLKASKDKSTKQKESTSEDTVWHRQESTEGNGNSNNNTDPFDDYENIVFPLQETRL